MSNLLGMVALENANVVVEGLMDYRSIPAISFLGRYRLIDFVVSNMTNSGIDNIKVFVKNKPRSLIEQLGDGRHYGINSKRGTLQILFNDQTNVSGFYNSDINTYLQNMEHIEKATEEYVVISPGYQLYTLNFNLVLYQHQATKADVTIIYKNVENASNSFLGCPSLTMDKGRVKAIETNVGQRKQQQISLETYIMKRELFIDLVKKAHRVSPIMTLNQMLTSSLKELKVLGYTYRGYFACINSIMAYYRASMELLDYDVAKNLFRSEWPIHTKTNDSVPTIYGQHAKAKHSIVANGCNIEGEIENCVIGRGVNIGVGSVIKNSIILPTSQIGSDCHIEYTIVDKHSSVNRVKEIKGSPYNVVYIRRRDKI